MNNQIIDFYLKEREPNKSCLMALRDVILNQDLRFTETLKYGMPCFVFKSKVLCYLWVDKKSNKPYILFVDGHMLAHHLLEKGNRKRMKILKVNPNEDLPVFEIEFILGQALALRNKK